jgi:hypothetical protein
VHEAGIPVRGFAVSEAKVKPANCERYIINDFEEA